MKRASQLFPEAERKRIADAVSAVEVKTSVEIVPVVATQSGRYDRAEDLFGLLAGLGALAGLWLAFQAAAPGEWGGTSYVIDWWLAILIVAAGFMVGTALASRVGWLRLLLTPRTEIKAEVARAASQAFFDQRVHHSQGGGALMLYVSLLERQVVLLADEQVTSKLGQLVFDELCAALRSSLGGKPAPEALIESIDKAGATLAVAFPATGAASREMPDALVLID